MQLLINQIYIHSKQNPNNNLRTSIICLICQCLFTKTSRIHENNQFVYNYIQKTIQMLCKNMLGCETSIINASEKSWFTPWN